MRDHADVVTRRLRTANYDDAARRRLGDAFAKAREAAGYKHISAFARAARIKSVASLEWLENGKPGVGQSILFAVGRFMPGWTEDTPRALLEGTEPARPDVAHPEVDAESSVEPADEYSEESDGVDVIGSDAWILKWAQHPDVLAIGLRVRKKRRELEVLKRILAAREAGVADSALPHGGSERS